MFDCYSSIVLGILNIFSYYGCVILSYKNTAFLFFNATPLKCDILFGR